MSIQEIKLLLIKRIVNNEDKQQLMKLLTELETLQGSEAGPSTENKEMIDVLLNNSKKQVDSSTTSQEGIHELQQSIDELFGN